ncbi:MAG: LPS O-antigen chain length determinant protein WzzB [Ostreibacterium sp.]
MTQQIIQIEKNDDEIDLIELIVSLWRKKWLIGFITLIFVIGAGGYAFFAKEVWISTAQIIAPNAKGLYNYLDRYEQYQLVINGTQSQSIIEDISMSLYNGFLHEIGSYQKQQNFFKQSGILKNYQKNGKTENQAMRLLFGSVVVSKPSKQKNYTTVSFTDEKADTAQKTLMALIKFINYGVVQTRLDSFNSEMLIKINILKMEQERIKQLAGRALQVRLKNLNKALQIAKKAGIENYSRLGGQGFIVPTNISGEMGIKLKDDSWSEDNFLFMLGENYLQAQIDTLASAEKVYPKSYYQIQLQIELLNQIFNKKKVLTFDTFSYQSSPNLPLQRDKPQRALIVIIGLLVGATIAVFIALLIIVLDTRKKKYKGSL